MAFDSEHEREAARPWIDAHPAFPAIVALWFAGLLGIGSLVLPGALLDRLISATGLASWLSAASPPLGITARSIIAFAAALGGAVLGAAIARRVARSNEPKGEQRSAKLADETPRPISVRDELGGGGDLPGVVNGRSLPISRRRAMAISEDEHPDDFLYRVPLPGEDPDAPTPFAAAPIVSAVRDDEPLVLSKPAQEDNEVPEMTDSPELASVRPSSQHHPRGSEPLPFAAPSLARSAPEDETALEPEAEVAAEAPATEFGRSEIRAPWQSAPLEGLGLVQLVQRLGTAIERRRKLMARATAVPAVLVETDFDPAAAEDAARAMAAYFGTEPQPEAIEQSADEPAPQGLADADAALRAALATLQRLSGVT